MWQGVLTAEECAAREEVLLQLYIGTVSTECGCLISMLDGNVIPDARRAGIDTADLEVGVAKLEAGMAAMATAHDSNSTSTAVVAAVAAVARVLRLETMEEVRAVADAVEAKVPAALWSLATYKELLFLDSTSASSASSASSSSRSLSPSLWRQSPLGHKSPLGSPTRHP